MHLWWAAVEFEERLQVDPTCVDPWPARWTQAVLEPSDQIVGVIVELGMADALHHVDIADADDALWITLHLGTPLKIKRTIERDGSYVFPAIALVRAILLPVATELAARPIRDGAKAGHYGVVAAPVGEPVAPVDRPLPFPDSHCPERRPTVPRLEFCRSDVQG